MLKHKRRFWLIGLLAAALLVLAACAPPAEETGVSEGDTAEEAIQPEEEATEEPTEEMTEEPTEEAMGTNAVEVEDQALGEDNTVVVPSATSDGPGWVVIHADDGGAPGPVIGFAPVSAGENTDVEVEVDPDGVTDTLYAMLHIDAGTEGEYEFPGDDGPARDADDNVVVKPFAVSMGEEDMAGNSVEVEDQALGEDNTVVVPSATSDGPGWVVIHADDSGAPGPVIGFAPVSAGENTDVEVELDSGGVTDTLYAMLHIDAGTEGEYEFPGDDGPARDADDNVVVKPFAVSMGEDSSMGGEEAVVTVLDGSFDEEELTVPVGTTVVWEQDGSFAHTVTADDGSFDSGTLNSGQRFSFTFDEPGTYPYYCEFHGGEGGSGMSGVIIVEG